MAMKSLSDALIPATMYAHIIYTMSLLCMGRVLLVSFYTTIVYRFCLKGFESMTISSLYYSILHICRASRESKRFEYK